MHGETQANRLAALMHKKGNFPSYELALPLVTVKSSDLGNLSVDDIFLLGVKHLECILLKEGVLCAKVVLSKEKNRHYFKIEKNYNECLDSSSGRKYENVLFSLGMLKSRTLEVGHLIDISQLALEKITVIHKEKKIAEGSLINIEGELAVQMDKVDKHE